MRDNKALIDALSSAMTERLNDPKNVAKGDFPVGLEDIMDLLLEEVHEVEIAYVKLNNSVKQQNFAELITRIRELRSELADLSVCAAFMVRVLDMLA